MLSRELIDMIWEKAQIVPGYNPSIFRKDACGAWIMRDKYKNRDSIFGWEIDHIYPKSLLKKKGYEDLYIDKMENLRPLQYQNNISKGDDYPSYISAVTSFENRNIYEKRSLSVNNLTQSTLAKLYNL